ncbi:MAG: NAD-dependent deacylase [Gammaproteobacteria bacterium]|nr:NAD-dependent deacylase [Gammaproteobacteria bacterium]
MSFTQFIPDELVEAMQRARHLTVLTGSGISAESGIPTFRDAQTGLWARYRPEELATPEAFLRNPRLIWEWYEWRRSLVAEAKPNAGHIALSELENHFQTLHLITQNVDGLHQRAGHKHVIEFHGNIHRNRCFEENKLVSEWKKKDGQIPPLCPDCGGSLRPDVVWFGEAIPEDTLSNACAASANCDLFMAIGTSAQVYPAAGLAEIAKGKNARIVEINTEKTPLSDYADYVLLGPAGKILPGIVTALTTN